MNKSMCRRWLGRTRLLLVLTLGVTAFSGVARERGVHAGVAVREIPTAAGTYMGAYPDRVDGVRQAKVAEGTRDPLFIKTVVIRENDVLLSLTACDMGGIPASVHERVRKALANRIPIAPDSVLIGATHTHSYPSIGGDFGLPVMTELLDKLTELITETILSAYQGLQPARMGAGHGSANLNRNRRFIQRSGTAGSIPPNLRKVPRYFGPVDQEVGVIRVDNRAGEPIALLVNYAGHPTIMTRPNRLFSAEYPGAMVRHVTPRLPAEVPVLFFNGAAGNVESIASNSDDWEWMERIGQALGDEVLRVYSEIATSASPGLLIRHRDLPFASRYAGVSGTAHLHMISFQDTIIATVGGELFAEIGLEFKRRSPFPHTMVFGYTDVPLGYIPHRDAYIHGGYGAEFWTSTESYRTRVPIGFGESILEAWLGMMHTAADRKAGAP